MEEEEMWTERNERRQEEEEKQKDRKEGIYSGAERGERDGTEIE